MRQIKSVFKVVLLFAAGLWILSVLPFRTTIRGEVPATLYRDGAAVGSTTVTLDGKRTNYLFRDNSYVGVFSIPEVERTGREGMRAQILWREDAGNVQRILYASPGMIYSDVLPNCIIANHDLTQFAFSLPDGSIAATSDMVYRFYTGHVTYYPDTGVYLIEGSVPFF